MTSKDQIDQMRKKIKAAYPTQTWKFKVETMPDDQVIAIYYRFLASNKIK